MDGPSIEAPIEHGIQVRSAAQHVGRKLIRNQDVGVAAHRKREHVSHLALLFAQVFSSSGL